MYEQPSNVGEQSTSIGRPVGIAEPLRRLSNGFLRTMKTSDKSIQVNTSIRSCSRCTNTLHGYVSKRKHSTVSIPTWTSSVTDPSSSCDDDGDDIDDEFFPPPNLDQLRQRRVTLIAKTILNQMATQSRSASVDEYISPLTSRDTKDSSSETASPMQVKCSIKVSSPETSYRHNNSYQEFSDISEQISSLLRPNEDDT
jgi:hypothetical protein